MGSKIIFPLDGDVGGDFNEMKYWATVLHNRIGMVKVGLRAYVKNGPAAIRQASVFMAPIMLDLKLHDIPNTMKEATEAVVDIWREQRSSIRILTVHAEAGVEALKQCVQVCKGTPISIAAITVLTSLPFDEIVFRKRVEMGVEAGVKMFVCSPNEVKLLKHLAPDVGVITPGIRCEGDEALDQKRVNTPRNAILNGADYLVVGRSIRHSISPIEMVGAINREIEEGMLGRA